MSRQDPPPVLHFRVEIDNLASAAFTEVTLGAGSVDVIEYREGTDRAIRKLPGLTRYGTITLKRGISQSRELFEWYKQVVDGDIANARRRVVVVLQDAARQDFVRFVANDAWPVKYEASSLKASANEVAIETLELAHEGLERVS